MKTTTPACSNCGKPSPEGECCDVCKTYFVTRGNEGTCLAFVPKKDLPETFEAYLINAIGEYTALVKVDHRALPAHPKIIRFNDSQYTYEGISFVPHVGWRAVYRSAMTLVIGKYNVTPFVAKVTKVF